MSAFRYEAIKTSGAPVQGVIEAEDRKTALQILGGRGLFPSTLKLSSADGGASAPPATVDVSPSRAQPFGKRIRRKEITAFTREMLQDILDHLSAQGTAWSIIAHTRWDRVIATSASASTRWIEASRWSKPSSAVRVAISSRGMSP